MKYVFIINPQAGKGRGEKIGQNIPKVCTAEKIDYVIHYTKEAKEATTIAKQYINDEVIIYSVGGDGTLNEIVNGIAGTKNMLGIIPAGSGNDFYRTIKDIATKNFQIDIGMINDHYFINETGIGIDTEIGINADRLKKKGIPSKQIYNASIFYTLWKYRFKKIHITINNTKKEGFFTIITICNGKYYGGGYSIGPNAILDDGFFDIYLIDKVNRLKMLSLLLKVVKGKHENSPYVHKYQTGEIIIEGDSEMQADYDGEKTQGKCFKIKLLKKHLTIYNDNGLVNKIMDC